MLINDDNAHLIAGALDTLASKLADYGHTWTEGERAIYEEALVILNPISSADCKGTDLSDEEICH